MRTPCSQFLAFILKFLNFLHAFVGVAIIIYSAYVLNQWQHHEEALRSSWFTYALLAIGILICFISFVGFVGAEAISGCCLCFYAVLAAVFILLEVGLVAFVALDENWKKDIPSDPTGELDSLWSFIKENGDVFMWIGIAVLTIQVLSLLLAIVLKSLVYRRKETDEIEGGYVSRNSTREPLLSPYSGQASGSTRGDSDIWSSRMREKYGLNTVGDSKQNTSNLKP